MNPWPYLQDEESDPRSGGGPNRLGIRPVSWFMLLGAWIGYLLLGPYEQSFSGLVPTAAGIGIALTFAAVMLTASGLGAILVRRVLHRSQFAANATFCMCAALVLTAATLFGPPPAPRAPTVVMVASTPSEPVSQDGPLPTPLEASGDETVEESDPADAHPAPHEIFNDVSPAVVRLIVEDEYGRRVGQGSGFLVSSDGLLVTNRHVVQSGKNVTVLMDTDAELALEKIICMDVKADLALLKTKGKNLPYLPLSNTTTPEVGTPVYAIGSPKGMTNTLSEGLISGIRNRHEDITVFQTTAPISYGSSGGPLVTTDGKVIGVTTSSLQSGQNLNFAIASVHVKRLLKPEAPAHAESARHDAKRWLKWARRETLLLNKGKADLYCEIARLQRAAGDDDSSRQSIELAAMAIEVEDPGYGSRRVRPPRRIASRREHEKSRAYLQLAETQVELEDYHAALRSAARIKDRSGRDRAYRLIAEALLANGDFDGTMQAAQAAAASMITRYD